MEEAWAVVELMGHVRLAGRLSEEEKFGAKLGRLDIPAEDGKFVTQYFGGSSVYRITVVSEEAARAVASRHKPRPVEAWEMPRSAQAALPAANDGDDGGDHYDYDRDCDRV